MESNYKPTSNLAKSRLVRTPSKHALPEQTTRHLASFSEEDFLLDMSRRGTKHNIEDDLETTLAPEEKPDKEQNYDWTGKTAYENACRKFGVVPASNFMKKLSYSNHIDIKHYGIGPKGAMALAIPMVINSSVQSLNLRGNHLGPEGTAHICRMMTENQTIEALDISENQLGLAGIQHVTLMLRHNKHLTQLKLAGNDFTDGDLAVIIPALEVHATLRTVDLSHNRFGMEAGPSLLQLLGGNDLLTELDISWNHISGPAALAVVKGVKENVSLKRLRLDWNGFGDEGTIALGPALETNNCLQELSLTANRIKDKGYAALVSSLKKNDTLLHLRLAKNHISPDAVRASVEMFLKIDGINLETLEVTDVFLPAEVLAMVVELKEKCPSLQVYSGYDSAEEKLDESRKKYNPVEQAMIALAGYAIQHKVKLVDLFADFDEDGSMSVTYDEFKEGLRRAKIPITPYQIEQLIAYLDKDGDGEIDFSELVLGTKKYEHVIASAQAEKPQSGVPS